MLSWIWRKRQSSAWHKDPKKRIILTNDNDDRRKLFETCMARRKAMCNPIIDWTDAVEAFLRERPVQTSGIISGPSISLSTPLYQ